MERIGIFGGTFDPVHIGHIAVARAAARRLELTRVILVPAGVPPHKKSGALCSPLHRYNMTCLAAGEDTLFYVSDFETKKKTPSYTYITAEHFKSLYKNASLYFIIGDEAYAELDTWRCPERVANAVSFAVVTRKNIPLPPGVVKISIPPIEVSSTQIRDKLRRGQDITGLVPDAVKDYIEKNKLYLEGKLD